MMNKSDWCLKWLLIIFSAISFLYCSHPGPKDYLKQGFVNPPDSAKPGVYWYFMDGNIDSLAITADLESMKEAGLGYALFLEVNVGVPRGRVDFLSEEWQNLFKHAVKQAERTGIRIILGSGPGWAGSGGPWVTPSQSMMHLVAADTSVNGPGLFDGKLPVPAPKRPFFGENSLTRELKNQRDNWYEDVFVLAFPAPSTRELIQRIDEKALYYRAPYTSQPGVLPFLPEPAPSEESHSSFLELKTIIDITDKLGKDGSLTWKIPAGKWTIMRFGKRNNGAVTRPAPLPGLGFECDKFDTASFDAHYDAYVNKLIKKTGPGKVNSGGGWTMIHIDSWEMGSQNWSPEFRKEFIKRRGYDPKLFLPVYTGLVVNSSEMSERFLWDLRQTSNELIIENHALRFKELGKRSGFRLSIEPYDMNPASDLDLGYVADVPMCEFWSDGYGFNSAFSCIEATSIGHVKGVPVIAAEAFTAGSNEAWKKYPGDMKDQGDWAFCMGINRLIYHTFAHKPYSDKYLPGMTMGPYGVHWDRGQTWWPLVKDYHLYISRCQYLLSQGRSVADILYLAAEGAPHVFRPPSSALTGTSAMPDKKEYSFDGCSPGYLIENAYVKNGKIVFPGGSEYHLLVLPDVNTMTPDLLEKIKILTEAGATIIGNPPVRSPSLTDYPACDDYVISIAKEMWGSNKIPSDAAQLSYGKGKIWWGKRFCNSHRGVPGDPDSLSLYPEYSAIKSILESDGIPPDFCASENLRYTHRSLTDREIYFISNKTGFKISDTCIFRDGRPYAELWDAVTGEIKPLSGVKIKDGITFLSLVLEPYQSCFVVFYDSPELKSNKEKEELDFPEAQILMKLEGPWKVAFDTSMGGPELVEFDTLIDWSLRKETGIKYYSGSALYSKTFRIPGSAGSLKKSDILLNLGTVRNIARVKLNNKDMGVIWTAPWRINISDAIRQGNNHLEITVINLWINRLIGDESESWDGIVDGKLPEWYLTDSSRPSKRYTFTTHRYYKMGDPLVESGLIGPVRIEILK